MTFFLLGFIAGMLTIAGAMYLADLPDRSERK